MPESIAAAPPTTAAPSSPPPAVSAPPTSAPAAPPSKEKSPPAGGDGKPSWLDDVGKDLESLSAEGDDKGKPKADKAEQGELEKGEEGAPAKKPDAEDAPKGDEQPGKPMKAATLRQALDDLKKEKREVLEPKIQQLEAKIKELSARQPDDVKPLMDKITAAQKRADELEEHIRFVDYKKSREFQEKYEQPYTEAWGKAVSDFGQLAVRVPDGTDETTGDPKFGTRQATADDLLYLANLPLSQMDDQAEAMFGRSAARVIRHVERVRELSDAQGKALAEAQKKGGEWAKTRQFQMQQFQHQQHTLWETYNKAIVEKFPDVFGPVEGDNDGNALLQRGFEEADRLFAPAADAKPQSTEERIQFHTKLRNKIANHDRLFRRLKTVQAELEDTKKALAEYEQSAPPAGRGGSPRAPTKGFMEEVEAELAQMDKP